MSAQLIAFVATCLVVIVVPGPDFVLVLRHTARARRPGAAWTAAGIILGLAVLGVAAALGVTALLAASEVVSTVVRTAGGIYLVWLGVQSLRSWFRLRGLDTDGRVRLDDDGSTAGVLGQRWSCFRQGLVSNLLNPKVVTFYLALFPQFDLAPLSPAAAHVVLAAAFWVLCLLWHVTLVASIARLGIFLQRPKVARRSEAVTGGVLVGLGGFVVARAH